MAIGLNTTLDRFVNWANQDGIGKTDLVHATKAQGTTGGAKVILAGNTGEGIGFFASRRRSADTRDQNNATRELFKKAVMDLFHAKTIALKNEIDQKAKNRYNMFFALDMKDSVSCSTVLKGGELMLDEVF